jgi:hypothetical protein
MREVIHDLQLKSAIDRQNLAKNQRAAAKLAQEVTDTNKTIIKLRKQKETDETYLLKQEKKLNKLRCTKPAETVDEQIHRLEKENQALFERITTVK